MDETDIKLCRLLTMDSRQPYRALSSALGISVQAIHRRIRSLEEAGVIRRYTVCLSDRFVGATKVRIMGSSALGSLEELAKALERDDRSLFLFFCSMDEVVVTALLRDMSELDEYTEFLGREVEMSNLRVAFTGPILFGEKGGREPMVDRPILSPIDYRIVRALTEDSRKSIAETAHALGISVKTVRRHLERMREERVLEFSIDYAPGSTPSAFAYLRVQVAPGVDKRSYMERFSERYDSYILLMHSMTSPPDFLVSLLWVPAQRVINDVVAELSTDPCVISVYTNPVQDNRVFRTWRERLVEERAMADG